jgi:hypothetical protein
MQKAILMLRDTWFMAILNCACALCTCVAQPSVLAICLAAVWQAKPLITSATKRSLEFWLTQDSLGSISARALPGVAAVSWEVIGQESE